MERLATLFLATVEETLPPFNFGRELVKMGVGLVLLLGLVFLCTFAIKRLARGRMAAFNGSHTIQVLERRPIGPKAVLYLLSLRGKEILVAYTPQGITPIYPLGTPVHAPSFESLIATHPLAGIDSSRRSTAHSSSPRSKDLASSD